MAMVKENRNIRPSLTFIKHLQIWEQAGFEVWENSETKLPKALYQVYVDERVAILKSKRTDCNESIAPLNL
jgi:hypothetical protein